MQNPRAGSFLEEANIWSHYQKDYNEGRGLTYVL